MLSKSPSKKCFLLFSAGEKPHTTANERSDVGLSGFSLATPVSHMDAGSSDPTFNRPEKAAEEGHSAWAPLSPSC